MPCGSPLIHRSLRRSRLAAVTAAIPAVIRPVAALPGTAALLNATVLHGVAVLPGAAALPGTAVRLSMGAPSGAAVLPTLAVLPSTDGHLGMAVLPSMDILPRAILFRTALYQHPIILCHK